MIDLLIFDCDGVLIDSEPLASACMADSFIEWGAKTDHAEVHRMFTGLGFDDGAALARQSWGITDYPARIARMNEMLYPRFAAELTEMAGMSDLLARFAHLPKCVASNSKVDRLDHSLGLLPIRAAFGDHVYSAEHVARGKPAPDLVYHCLDKMRRRRDQALMVDDSPHGLEAAVAAGVLAIGFVDPADPRAGRIEALQAAGADYVVTGVAELSDLIARLTAPQVEEVRHG